MPTPTPGPGTRDDADDPARAHPTDAAVARAQEERSDRDDARDGVDDSDAITARGPVAVDLAAAAKVSGKAQGKGSRARRDRRGRGR